MPAAGLRGEFAMATGTVRTSRSSSRECAPAPTPPPFGATLPPCGGPQARVLAFLVVDEADRLLNQFYNA